MINFFKSPQFSLIVNLRAFVLANFLMKENFRFYWLDVEKIGFIKREQQSNKIKNVMSKSQFSSKLKLSQFLKLLQSQNIIIIHKYIYNKS